MNFIQSKDGQHFPVSRIVRIGVPREDNGDSVVSVEFEGYGPADVYRFRVDDLLRQPVQAFAALPGTHLLRLDDTEKGYWSMQIVGWSVARDGNLYPITADGINDGDADDHYVLTPDGRVSQAANTSWNSVAEFLEANQPNG